MKKLYITLGVLIVTVAGISLFYSQKQPIVLVPMQQSVDETSVVEKYVHTHIKVIATNSTVLGGSWYVTAVEINTSTKSGKVVYEDGHIQSTAIFKYLFNNISGEVTISNFTLLN